jgi:hypothetical protein
VGDSSPRGRVNALAVFKILSGLTSCEAVTCIVGCLIGGSSQDHPAHILRVSQLPSGQPLTSWRSPPDWRVCAPLVPAVAVPAPSRELAATEVPLT